MAQGRQQNNGSRQRCAQSAAAKAPAEPPKAVCAQLEQMNRKLAAASAEILRYQTRLFACERQMAALRQENAQLEAACEQARQEAECASAHAEQLRQELARHAESVGVDAIASIPPIYFHLPEYAIAKYWNDMSAAAPNTEFVIYNIPQLAGTGLTMSLLKEMLKNPNVVAVKNSSMPTQDIQMFKDAGIAARGEGNFVVFNGPDEQFVSGRVIGADGGIGGTYAVMPELYLAMNDHINKGEIKQAQEIQYEADRIIYKMCEAHGNLYAVQKEILRRMYGLELGGVREPMPGLIPEDEAIVAEAQAMIEAAIAKL